MLAAFHRVGPPAALTVALVATVGWIGHRAKKAAQRENLTAGTRSFSCKFCLCKMGFGVTRSPVAPCQMPSRSNGSYRIGWR